VQEFEPLAVDAGIPLRIEAAENLPTIEVDSGRIRQALANLLANALRYTPQGGAVTVLISQQAKALQIAVEDSGPGLSPEQISHIFERFYRTDEARQRDSGGAGLGLAIARELILLHEGQLTAESEPGRGSRFKISLPLNTDSHPQEKGAK
jgi:two-component system sensor histidine kinase BaeS